MTTRQKQSMSEQLGVNPSDLESRKSWNGFSDEHVAVLNDVRELANENAAEIIHKFYDHSFSFQAFAETVRKAGGSRANLEIAQTEYFKELFGGTYDMAYAERRLAIGSVPHKWGSAHAITWAHTSSSTSTCSRSW